jgi:hypothetical protein
MPEEVKVNNVDYIRIAVKDLDRYFAFVHPKDCHGVLTEVIEGQYP